MGGPLTLVYATVARLGEAEDLALELRRSGTRAHVRDVALLHPDEPEPCDALLALGADALEVVKRCYPGRDVSAGRATRKGAKAGKE